MSCIGQYSRWGLRLFLIVFPCRSLACAEGKGSRKGGTERCIVDLRRTKNADDHPAPSDVPVHKDHQRIATNKKLLKGARRVHNHRQFLKMNRLQSEGVIGMKHTRSTLQPVVANIVQISLLRHFKHIHIFRKLSDNRIC